VEDADRLGLEDVPHPTGGGPGLGHRREVAREHPRVLPPAGVEAPAADPRDLVTGEVAVDLTGSPRHRRDEREDLGLVDQLAVAGPEPGDVPGVVAVGDDELAAVDTAGVVDGPHGGEYGGGHRL